MVPAQRQSTTSPCKPQKSLSKHQFLLSKPPSIVPYWRQHHFPLISASISIDYSSQHVSISFPCRYFMSYSSSQQNLFSVCLHEFRRTKKYTSQHQNSLSLNSTTSCIVINHWISATKDKRRLNGLILHLALKIVMRRQRRLRGEGADWEEHCDLDLLSSDDDAWWSGWQWMNGMGKGEGKVDMALKVCELDEK